MHHRFPFFPFSRYYRREPEIVADAPHRIDPGQPLPVTILIKDSDRFPCTLKSVWIRIKGNNNKVVETRRSYDLSLHQQWFEDTLLIEPEDLTGPVHIWPIIEVLIRGKKRVIITHNVKTTYQFLLQTVIDPEPLPGNDRYWWGDLHYHSSYTEDFVEFGAPLEATRITATALGLDYLAITDHSYDLDDQDGSWNESDPTLRKWHAFQDTVKAINTNGGTLLIPGEEVTSRNARGKNVHTLVLNCPTFLPGSGDGAESYLPTPTEHTIEEILEYEGPQVAVIAAHAFSPFSQLERWLLNRGKWGKTDCIHERLSGLQIVNGVFDGAVQEGLKTWIQILLEGHRKFIYAGNDAHGNFNRFHQIKRPMWSTYTHRRQVLGQWRTGILKSKTLSIMEIIQGLKNGRCIISDGPAVELRVLANNESYTLGDSANARNISIFVDCYSSKMYGSLATLILYQGIVGSRVEKELLHLRFREGMFQHTEKKTVQWEDSAGYIRCELLTLTGRRCYTNPIWIRPQ
jgi:hypothetical protein